MFCRFCGREVPEKSVFCLSCGKKIDRPDSPEEGIVNEPAKENVPYEPRPDKKITAQYVNRRTLVRELTIEYTQILRPLLGFRAKSMAKKMINTFEKQIKDTGTDAVPSNYGDILVEQISKMPPGTLASDFVKNALADGATLDDVRIYYNTDSLKREMDNFVDQTVRFSLFSYLRDQGMSVEATMGKIKKEFPIYENFKSEEYSEGDDRPLSLALYPRIEKYRLARGARIILREAVHYSSFNAYIRQKIREGLV